MFILVCFHAVPSLVHTMLYRTYRK